MKAQFKKYHIKTETELQDLLKSHDTLFVFDTCVLLDFFRCTEHTREELKNILEGCAERLYMPYQIGKEFYKNRHNIIPDIDEQIKQLKNKLKGTSNEIKSRFAKGTYFLASLSDKVEHSIERIINNMSVKQKDFHKTIKEEELCEFFESIFDGRVGKKQPITQSEINNYNTRVANGTPPGEKDSENKSKPYGDYIIWLDILNKAETEHKNIVFITSETKSDWFYKSKAGDIIAPRAELLEEFFDKTKQDIHIYNIAKFVEDWHKLNLQDRSPTKVIAELKKMFRVKEPNNSEVQTSKTGPSFESALPDETSNVKI